MKPAMLDPLRPPGKAVGIQTLIGRWDEGKAKRWTIVSMKDDWKTMFPK